MDQGKELNSPKVSVIIPVYNTEAYLEEAVRSIMNQTLKDIEIIIIDDGSTDNSLTVIKKLAMEDNRIKWLTQQNSGQSVARNIGIESARGGYLYFMDSDDILETDALMSCYQLINRKNLDFVFFDAASFSEAGLIESDKSYKRTYLFREEDLLSGKEMLNRMLDHMIYRASPCLNLIDSHFLNKIQLRFYPGIVHEDELFTSVLYLHASRVACIQRDFYKRRIRSGSTMTTKFSHRNIEGYLTVARELQQNSETEQNEKATIHRLISYILNPAIYNSRNLSLKQRLWVISECSRHHLLSCIRIKNVFVILLPSLVIVKGLLKRDFK
jgi:glycosyltransferase involved in cell wall biosynthesis